jgi:hypothetical protein
MNEATITLTRAAPLRRTNAICSNFSFQGNVSEKIQYTVQKNSVELGNDRSDFSHQPLIDTKIITFLFPVGFYF